MLQTRLGLSAGGRAGTNGQARSSQRYQPADPDPDSELGAWLLEFSAKRPRWGYRRAHVEAAKAGHVCNIKRIHRLWREEGLRVPPSAGNDAVSARRRSVPDGAPQPHRIRSGHSTSSSTSLLLAARSSC